MTAEQMRFKFQELYEAALYRTDVKTKFIDSNTIFKFLNDAQLTIIRGYWSSGRYDMISTIVDEIEATPHFSYITPCITNVLLPDNLLYYISSKSKISRYNIGLNNELSSYVTINEEILPFTSTQFIQKDSMDRTLFRNPKCYLDGKFLRVVVDSYTDDVDNIYITYVRRPVKISINGEASVHCELNSHTHLLIVEQAVMDALRYFASRDGEEAQERPNSN